VRVVALTFAILYLGATALSVVIAHILLVAKPQSGLAERIIAPVGAALGFLDTHWKSVLIMVGPFLAPVIRELVPRLRKVGSVEFDAVPLEPVGVREKPARVPPGV